MERFYCPKCRKFLKRRQVRFADNGWLPHYICRWCHTDVIEIVEVLEKIIEEWITKEEFR